MHASSTSAVATAAGLVAQVDVKLRSAASCAFPELAAPTAVGNQSVKVFTQPDGEAPFRDVRKPSVSYLGSSCTIAVGTIYLLQL